MSQATKRGRAFPNWLRRSKHSRPQTPSRRRRSASGRSTLRRGTDHRPHPPPDGGHCTKSSDRFRCPTGSRRLLAGGNAAEFIRHATDDVSGTYHSGAATEERRPRPELIQPAESNRFCSAELVDESDNLLNNKVTDCWQVRLPRSMRHLLRKQRNGTPTHGTDEIRTLLIPLVRMR